MTTLAEEIRFPTGPIEAGDMSPTLQIAARVVVEILDAPRATDALARAAYFLNVSLSGDERAPRMASATGNSLRALLLFLETGVLAPDDDDERDIGGARELAWRVLEIPAAVHAAIRDDRLNAFFLVLQAPDATRDIASRVTGHALAVGPSARLGLPQCSSDRGRRETRSVVLQPPAYEVTAEMLPLRTVDSADDGAR